MIIGVDASRANRVHKTGTEWYSYHLIKNLAQIDSKNEYILYADSPIIGGLLDLRDNHKSKIECFCEEKFDENGYQIIKSPYNNFKAKILNWYFLHFWTLGRLTIEMLINKPDVLFIPAHTLPLTFHKNIVNTIHDVAFERDRHLYNKEIMLYEDKFFKIFLNIFIKIVTFNKYTASSLDYLSWSTKFALKRAKKIITVSKFSKKEILEIYGCKDDLINVIWNGYNTNIYKKIIDNKKINKVLNKYGVKKPYLLYVGRLEKKKNTSFLVESFAMLKEYNKNIKHKLVLIGSASFGYDEVKYMIREFNLDDDVIMPGWIEEDDMPFFYNGAEAFIFPSKYEGFGIPVIQAMACEIPVVCSNIPVLMEIAKNAVLFFNPYDKESAVDAMKKIIEDDGLRSKLIKLGKKRAKNFSWEKCARETLRVIES